MDTSNYLYAAYMAFWILPTLYLVFLFKKTSDIGKKVDHALDLLHKRD